MIDLKFSLLRCYINTNVNLRFYLKFAPLSVSSVLRDNILVHITETEIWESDPHISLFISMLHLIKPCTPPSKNQFILLTFFHYVTLILTVNLTGSIITWGISLWAHLLGDV